MKKKIILDENGKALRVNGNILATYISDYIRLTGTAPLSFQASAGSFGYLKQNGVCEQNGTPTPSVPVDIKCNNGTIKYGQYGKNLNVGELDNVGYTSTGGTSTSTAFCGTLWKFAVTEGDKYTVSFGNFPGGVSGVFINTWLTDGTWNLRQAISTGSGNSLTYTIGADVGFVNFTLYKTGGITIGENSWMQVEAGADATAYEPAHFGLHTEGTPEVLTVCGINLLDPSTSNIKIGQNVTVNGEITSEYPNNWRTDYIPVVGGKTYAFWGRAKADNTISAYNRIYWFTADKTHIYPRPSYTVDTVTVGTAPSNAAFAMLSCSPYKSNTAITREDFDLYNWMFVETSQEIPYQPYVTPQTASVANLLQVGDYKDEQDIISGGVTREVGIKVLDGTESVSASGAGWAIGIADKLRSKLELFCTHYPYSSSNMANAPDKSIVSFASQNIGIKDSSFTSASDVTTWLAAQYAAGTPVIVVYPLATETTESVVGQSLNTVNGSNVISVTAEVSDIPLDIEYLEA